MLICRCDMCKKEIPKGAKYHKILIAENGKCFDTINVSNLKAFDMCEQCVTILFEGLLRNKEERNNANL